MNLYSLETEQSLIGQLLLDPESFGRLENLKPDHFYSSNLKTIYQTIEQINYDGQTADVLTVLDRLKRAGRLDKVGGATFLTDLQEGAISSATINQSESRLIEYYRRRILDGALKNISARLNKMTSDEAESELMAVMQSLETPNGGGFRTAKSLCHDFIDDLDEQKSTAIKTGFYEFDGLTGGLKSGNYTILAAATSMGKTSLALNIASNISKNGIPVGIVSLEMPGVQLIRRLVFSEAGIDGGGKLEKSDYDRIAKTVPKVAELPLFFDDGGCNDFGRLLSRISLLLRRHKIKVLIIDYIQLLHFRGETRNLEIQAISGAIKRLALSENVSVIALSQLNRAADGFPKLANLRDSGSLEQDADQVLFIYRPEQLGIKNFNNEPTENVAFCQLAKNRHGQTGNFKLRFENATFKNPSSREAKF